MTTLAIMKSRIAQELRRDDLTSDIANAISSAIAHYQYDRFPTFNNASLQAAPATDGETGNPWMNIAESLIRNHAKGLLYLGVMKEPQNGKIYLDMADAIERKLKVSNLYQALSNYTVGTLGYMKARIANEIERGDLVNEVAAAVATAIDYYQNERFWFNETRDITFPTVANQYRYTSADVAEIGNLVKIDYVFAYIGAQPYRVLPLAPEIQEWSHLSSSDPTGQPIHFTYYAKTLAIYPTPDQAYTIRIGASHIVAAPASDIEANNPWMTLAENMIRARAKFELYTHVPSLMDTTKAGIMKGMADDAFKQLKERTADLEKTGDYLIEAWGY